MPMLMLIRSRVLPAGVTAEAGTETAQSYDSIRDTHKTQTQGASVHRAIGKRVQTCAAANYFGVYPALGVHAPSRSMRERAVMKGGDESGAFTCRMKSE